MPVHHDIGATAPGPAGRHAAEQAPLKCETPAGRPGLQGDQEAVDRRDATGIAVPEQGKSQAAPLDRGTATAAAVGEFLERKATVRAEVLCRMLAGESLTGLDAVSGASTTRLAAVVHALTAEYGWKVERVDKAVGCKDGRATAVAVYFFTPATIEDAQRRGAAKWCAEVRAARAELRSQAAAAQRAAAQANAARSKRSGPSPVAQGDLFQFGRGVAP